MTSANHFELLGTDGQARTGKLATPHGVVRTPAFMPVGTAGAMKGLHWREVRDAGTDIVLGNTYHLMLRPGAERIAGLGGLQSFTGWRGPMLTDSGGFQVMSLAQLRKLSESAVTFRSHIDGARIELSPERSIEVQRLLGSDIAMQMDECVRLPAEHSDIERAMQLSLRWGERSKRAFETAPEGCMLFGIAQGGDVPELRRRSARGLVEMARLGEALGADPETFSGLAGMGDLVVTCWHPHGRNRFDSFESRRTPRSSVRFCASLYESLIAPQPALDYHDFALAVLPSSLIPTSPNTQLLHGVCKLKRLCLGPYQIWCFLP